MIIVSDTERCTGCEACELACSYHHKQIFSPSIASIHIQRKEAEGKVDIILYRQAEDGHLACNCPKGRESCLNFCTEAARDELEAVLQLKGDK